MSSCSFSGSSFKTSRTSISVSSLAWSLQQHFQELGARLTEFERDVEKRLRMAREEMEAHVADELAAAHGRYLEARRLGVLLLGVGLGCVTAANFF